MAGLTFNRFIIKQYSLYNVATGQSGGTDFYQKYCTGVKDRKKVAQGCTTFIKRES